MSYRSSRGRRGGSYRKAGRKRGRGSRSIRGISVARGGTRI